MEVSLLKWGFKIILATSMLMGINYYGVMAIDKDNTCDEVTKVCREEIILDGMIGPYDPTDLDQGPGFDDFIADGGELEGNLPGQDNYYTIAVSVPTQMQFTIIFERFLAPQYTIENRATRPIYITVTALNEHSFQEDEKVKKLHLATPDNTNDDIEADISLSMLNNTDSANPVKNNVNLSNFDSSNINYLGKLGLKESAILQFESTDFEIPGRTAPKYSAENKFQLGLTFSLDDPTQSTQP